MESTTKSEHPIIENSFVTCYSDRLVVHLYYFPIGSKTIKYKDIQSCELISMRDLGFSKFRMWGLALSPIWWHADFHRHSREYCIILDANQWPKIGLTMHDDEIKNVHELIKQHMNTNQSTATSYETRSFDPINEYDANTVELMSEKELEHQKFLERNKTK
jgi:hypothetical protein